MKNAYYGYIRVSTLKQEAGVSLIEQKDAITRYAASHGLEISEWLEEKETAAKQGRPVFSSMMKMLKGRKAKGVIMHKIDRSARNLRDWSDLGALIDQGVDVRFAHESLDLTARGGRLSADIQAVIASDYIRNLREEAKKGLYGRLKQGIYPFRAPLGYLDTGSGNVKTKDPAKAPLVRKAFDLYASQQYSLRALVEEMDRLGLRNYNGKRLHRSNMAIILGNPFYVGILRTKGQYFKGLHEPLVSPKLFTTVQNLLHGKAVKKARSHEFLFRRLLKCKSCGRFLYGEMQKGNAYYRCHTVDCTTKCMRGTAIASLIRRHLSLLQLLPIEAETLDRNLDEMGRNNRQLIEESLKAVRLQIASVKHRIDLLTDAYLDGVLDKESFQDRKQRLLLELSAKDAAETALQQDSDQIFKRTKEFLELAKSLVDTFELGVFDEKRRLMETVFSNLVIEGKKLTMTMQLPFCNLAFAEPVLLGALERDTPRLHSLEVDSEQREILVDRKQMTEQQLRGLIEWLVTHAELLPELPPEELLDSST